MEGLTLTGTMTTTLVCNFELRAGTQDSTTWLGGGSTYPGTLTGFEPRQTDGTNGYVSGPKMALINFTGGADNETCILAGGIESILGVFINENAAAPLAETHASNNHTFNTSFAALTITLNVQGGETDVAGQMLVLYL